MTVRELINETAAVFMDCGIRDYRGEAERLFLYAEDLNFASYLAALDEEVSENTEKKYRAMAAERKKRVPMQHILGKAPFYGRDFKVDQRVLVPRFDTEILVQEVLRDVPESASILDLGTGSGCIAVTLKKERPDYRVMASDISKDALCVAEENAEANSAEIEFIESDLFKNITESFDVLVSNPPYIMRREIVKLEPEVRDHDPVLALDGGTDGLIYYRKIAKCVKKHFAKTRAAKDGQRGGSVKPKVFLEIGEDQKDEVVKILEKEGFQQIFVVCDLSDRPRVVKAVYEG